MSSYRKTMKEALEEVSLYGQKLEEAMPPTKHVSSEGDKFVVKDMNGKVVQKFMDKDEADEYATKNHDKLMSAEEVEEEIEEEEADLDEASKLPPHLAKFFDKKGNLKPDAAKRVAKGKSKKDVASRTTDVTPKGYGPSEEIEEEEVDEGIMGNLAKAAGNAVVKKVSDVVKDKTVGAVSRTVKKVSDKVSDATGVTAVKKGVKKVGKVISKVKGAANKIKKAAQTGEEVDLDEASDHRKDYETFVKMYTQLNKAMDDASAKLKKFPKGAMGMMDDKVRNSPEYKKAKAEYEKVSNLTKRFLKGVPKDFLKKNARSRREEADLDDKNKLNEEELGEQIVNKNYLETKSGSIEQSVMEIWKNATVVTEKKLDPVGKEDGDIDNDGDKDSSDKYLAKRRKAISKSMKKEEEEVDLDESNPAKMSDDVLKSRLAQMEKSLKIHVDSPATQFEIKRLKKEMKKRGIQEEAEMDANESYEMGTDEYRNHTQSITPGQEVTDYQNFKVESMKEALAKVWGLDEWKNTKENRRVDGGDKRRLENKVKSGKTITGKTSDVIDLKPTTEEKQLDDDMNSKEEEKMVTANYMIKSGKSAEDVAKVINVDVKEIKKVMSAYHDEQNSHYKEYLAAACGGGAPMNPDAG